MPLPHVSRSLVWFLLVFVLASLLLVRESQQPAGALAGVDRAFFDWLVANARLDPANRGEIAVTLVEIDDRIAEMPGRARLSALEYGAFFRAMGRFDPAVVAVEPVLDFGPVGSGTEQILIDQAYGISKLLLGVRLGDSAGSGLDPSSLPALPNRVEGKLSGLANFPEIVSAPDSRLQALAAASGATNLPLGEVGPVRDVPLVFRSRGRVLPAFTLQALILSLRLAPSEVHTTLGQAIQLADRLRLPLNRSGRSLLDAREFSRIHRLSLDDLPLLEAGQATAQTRTVADHMREGVVILGRTDAATRRLRMPDGRKISPAELFAWAAVSLQHAPSTRHASTGWDIATAVVFAVTAAYGRTRPRAQSLAIAAATLLLYFLAALSLFEGPRLWLPLALPAGLTLLVGVLACLLSESPAAEIDRSRNLL